jgi:hypothetical protein
MCLVGAVSHCGLWGIQVVPQRPCKLKKLHSSVLHDNMYGQHCTLKILQAVHCPTPTVVLFTHLSVWSGPPTSPPLTASTAGLTDMKESTLQHVSPDSPAQQVPLFLATQGAADTAHSHTVTQCATRIACVSSSMLCGGGLGNAGSCKHTAACKQHQPGKP